MTQSLITQEHIDAYQKDGVVFIKGLFRHFVEKLRVGIDANMSEPSEFGAENLNVGEQGRFFDDYCNWTRISQFEDVVRNSPAAEIAADLMQSDTVQIFHDHVLVKEPGTSKPTPWHQDSPYYFVDGTQTISFWTPLDRVDEASLRCVKGSHLWQKPVLPTRWLSEESFYTDENFYMAVPDPDAENMPIVEWQMEPGDAVAFHFKTLHGARGNNTKSRRRAFSLRFVGDDARYVERDGPTSPPFPGHDLSPGQRLREDWFPVVYSR